MIKDFFGTEIEVGDRVLYVSSTYHYSRYMATVIELRKRVKIKMDNRTNNHTDWVDANSLFCIPAHKGEIPEYIQEEILAYAKHDQQHGTVTES